MSEQKAPVRHNFKIRLGTCAGPTCSIEMDGKPVSVRSVKIQAGVGNVTTVVLEIIPDVVEIEAEVIERGLDMKFVDVTKLHDAVRHFEALERKE